MRPGETVLTAGVVAHVFGLDAARAKRRRSQAAKDMRFSPANHRPSTLNRQESLRPPRPAWHLRHTGFAGNTSPQNGCSGPFGAWGGLWYLKSFS